MLRSKNQHRFFKIISDLVAKLTGNEDLISKFIATPYPRSKTSRVLICIRASWMNVVKGVTSQVGCISGSVIKEAGGLINKRSRIYSVVNN